MSRRRDEGRVTETDLAYAAADAYRVSDAAQILGVDFDTMKKLAHNIPNVGIPHKGQEMRGLRKEAVDALAGKLGRVATTHRADGKP